MLGDPSLCPPSWRSAGAPCPLLRDRAPPAQQLRCEAPEPRAFPPPGLLLCGAFGLRHFLTPLPPLGSGVAEALAVFPLPVNTHSLSKEVEALLCTGCCEGGEVRSDGICELNRPGPSPHDVARKTDSQVVSKREHVSSWIVAQLAQLWESCGGCREGVGV